MIMYTVQTTSYYAIACRINAMVDVSLLLAFVLYESSSVDL